MAVSPQQKAEAAAQALKTPPRGAAVKPDAASGKSSGSGTKKQARSEK